MTFTVVSRHTTFFVTIYNPQTGRHSVSRVVALGESEARERVVEDFAAHGDNVLVEKVECE